MGADFSYSRKILKESIIANVKAELKANRKKNTTWKLLKGRYNAPINRVVAMRHITPRGIQKEWNDGSITTHEPVFEHGEYFWRQTDRTKPDPLKEYDLKQSRIGWLPIHKQIWIRIKEHFGYEYER